MFLSIPTRTEELYFSILSYVCYFRLLRLEKLEESNPLVQYDIGFHICEENGPLYKIKYEYV